MADGQVNVPEGPNTAERGAAAVISGDPLLLSLMEQMIDLQKENLDLQRNGSAAATRSLRDRHSRVSLMSLTGQCLSVVGPDIKR